MKLAIRGGTPVRTKAYPAWPVHDEREISALTAVIQSGQWGGHPYPGPQTARFTQAFATFQGGANPVAMANGTVSLEVALRAADIGWGDEVIVPAYTFHATAVAVLSAGAIPVICDIEPERYTICPRALEAAITPQTRAIIPVHLGSQMADMDAVMAIAARHSLVVIEDCAQAHGATWRGQGAGTFGDFGSFSFQSGKVLTMGEGGLLLCRTPTQAERVMTLIDCGRAHDAKGEQFWLGTNYRMTEFQAALGNVALERLAEQSEQREEMASYLEHLLATVPGVRLLKRDPRHTARSFFQYIFAINPALFGAERDMACIALALEGIPCTTGHEPLHRTDMFQPARSKLPVPRAFPERFQYESLSFPEAERATLHEAICLSERVLRDGPQGIEDLVAAITKVQRRAAELHDLKPYKQKLLALAKRAIRREPGPA